MTRVMLVIGRPVMPAQTAPPPKPKRRQIERARAPRKSRARTVVPEVIEEDVTPRDLDAGGRLEIMDRLARSEQAMMEMAQAIGRLTNHIQQMGITPKPGEIPKLEPATDIRALGAEFLDEKLKDIPSKNKAKRSTYRSAIEHWWSSHEQPTWPIDAAIEEFRRKQAFRYSSGYADSHALVISQFRDWLAARGAQPPASSTVAKLKAKKINIDDIALVDGAVHLHPDSIRKVAEVTAHVTERAIFSGEASSDYYSTLIRRVSKHIGPIGLAKVLGVDEHTATKWIESRRVPQHAHKKLEDLEFLIQAKVRQHQGLDIEDIYDKVAALESITRIEVFPE